MERDAETVAALKALGCRSRCVRGCECEELPCPLLTWLVCELRQSCPELGARGAGGAVLAAELQEMLDLCFYPQHSDSSETLTPAHLSRVTDFLVSELQAAQMLKYREEHPEDTEPQPDSAREQRQRDAPLTDAETGEEKEETGTAEGTNDEKEVTRELTLLFHALDMNPASQIADVYPQVESRLEEVPQGEAREPLLKTSLTSSQWSKVEEINRALCRDYGCRRQMMMKRFFVTLQSFAWGERGQERSAVLAAVPPFSAPLKSSISVASLLAARADQSRILPVRAGRSTAVHKVLMGSVPDRGGRPGEIEPPMPSFSQRSAAGDGQKRQRGKFQKREYWGKKKKNKNK